ncbi:hypothetical protein FACS1894120_6290 [Clostridia bacterium]|nr:hypothetical protein FACS1894120_6290 [Clostridia bacterium]
MAVVQSAVKDIQVQKASALVELGTLYYEKIRSGARVSDAEKSAADRIKQIDYRLAQALEIAVPAEGSGICPGCKGGIDAGTIFCPLCGFAVKDYGVSR